MEEKLLAVLERLAQAERSLLTREAHRLGLTALQGQLLLHLSARTWGVVALAELLALTPATVSEALTALERKGFLQRRYNPKDRRRYLLEPTEEGIQAAQSLKAYAEPLRQALARVNQEALLAPLMEVLAHLVRQGVVADTGMCFTCRHLRRDRGFFCDLLSLDLSLPDLRLACPDHRPA